MRAVAVLWGAFFLINFNAAITAASVALMSAMSLGVRLAGTVAWQLPLVPTALLASGFCLAAARLPPTPREGRAASRVTLATDRERVLSLASGTGPLLMAYVARSTGTFAFIGLYPTWILRDDLPDRGPAVIGAMLFVGEVGGFAGAMVSGWVAKRVARPLGLCTGVVLATALIVASVPFGQGNLPFQTLAYAAYAFGRDMITALLLQGAMAVVPAAERGRLGAILNATFQLGGAVGALAGAALYAADPGFLANAAASAALFVGMGGLLRRADARRPAA
ncbi:MFS transporter [Methylobacterium sp. WSM2598]|uniref:MFS transporter n=1 Tax=Methylobacterium sp. WSM2598 TaxID=398261 RepID=UPI00037B1C20|nr:MFS transporter [Methylobacterium sp. WSM2598]